MPIALALSLVLASIAGDLTIAGDAQGSLRVVSPRDAKGARWVRMLERIEIVRLLK